MMIVYWDSHQNISSERNKDKCDRNEVVKENDNHYIATEFDITMSQIYFITTNNGSKALAAGKLVCDKFRELEQLESCKEERMTLKLKNFFIVEPMAFKPSHMAFNLSVMQRTH